MLSQPSIIAYVGKCHRRLASPDATMPTAASDRPTPLPESVARVSVAVAQRRIAFGRLCAAIQTYSPGHVHSFDARLLHQASIPCLHPPRHTQFPPAFPRLRRGGGGPIVRTA